MSVFVFYAIDRRIADDCSVCWLNILWEISEFSLKILTGNSHIFTRQSEGLRPSKIIEGRPQRMGESEELHKELYRKLYRKLHQEIYTENCKKRVKTPNHWQPSTNTPPIPVELISTTPSSGKRFGSATELVTMRLSMRVRLMSRKQSKRFAYRNHSLVILIYFDSFANCSRQESLVETL